MSEQMPRFEYTPEQEAEFAARDAAFAEAEQPKSEFLHGPRKVGNVPLPAGGFEEHRVSPDGMKYTRVSGERYKSAAEFHRAAGVAQDYEMESTEKAPQAEPRRRRAAKMLGRIINRRR